MNINKLLFLISLLFIGVIACKKENITEINKSTVTVPNNQAPSDTTKVPNNIKVDTTTVENYIYKTYISLIGRKPTDSELNISRTLLLANNASTNDRKTFISSVQSKQGYYDNLFRIANADLLNALDTADITLYIYIFQTAINQNPNDPGTPALQLEIDKLVSLRQGIADHSAGIIDFRELQKRMVNNYFYDQLNMGSANYVISMFQHFLFRYPTDSELAAGVSMCDNLSSIAFNVNGSSKGDFWTIFFNTNDYYEGRVRDLYKRHLYRDPSSNEMTNLAAKYKTGTSYKDVQREILITNEYLGIK